MERRRGRRPARQARPARLRAVEGPQGRRAGDGVLALAAGVRGRPGWHLECSAMARRTSATRSTSTAAASTCASRTTRTSWRSRAPPGDGFARYWVHNAWVTVGGEKMSKSLGNSLRGQRGRQGARPARRALLPRRPRTTARRLEFHRRARSREAEAAVERIDGFVERARPASDRRVPTGARGRCPDELPRGDGRRPRRARRARRPARGRARRQHGARRRRPRGGRGVRRAACVAMTDVLGIDPLDAGLAGRRLPAHRRPRAALDALVADRARPSARRRGRHATGPPPTRIRDALAAAGIVARGHRPTAPVGASCDDGG